MKSKTTKRSPKGRFETTEPGTNLTEPLFVRVEPGTKRLLELYSQDKRRSASAIVNAALKSQMKGFDPIAAQDVDLDEEEQPERRISFSTRR